MEVIILLLLIVAIVLISNIKAGLDKRFLSLEHQIATLKALLQKGQEQQADYTSTLKKEVEPEPSELTDLPKSKEHLPTPTGGSVTVEKATQVITPKATPPKFKPAQHQPSFFERHPDLEKFIGENLVNKIGIAILVLAIAYFVKLAIDNQWIGPVGRVAVGMLCGSILIGFAHRLRKDYIAFSSVLAGGGLAIYYFTITLAFHQFHLLSQTASFIILIGITLFAVALALLYDKQELGIIALVGGMASPFMVSTGQANYTGLFICLLILNTGLLIIALYKAWRIMNISAFALTVLVFTAVLFSVPASTDSVILIYASLFYLLFFAINIVNNVRQSKSFIASDYSILLINTAFYFAAGLYLLGDMRLTQYRGLFSAALAAINLVLSYALFRNKKVDTNILYLLIGITLTFISLTAPIQLHGNNITLFWASETVLLYWLFQRTNIKLMKITALLVWLLMLGSLGIDLVRVYDNNSVRLTIMANRGFVTGVCAAISTYFLYILVQRDTPDQQSKWHVDSRLLHSVSFVLLFISGALEVNHQFSNHYPGTSLNVIYLMLYTTAFVSIINLIIRHADERLYQRVLTGTIAATVIVYLILMPFAFDIQQSMLERHHPPGIHFLAHWAGTLFVGGLIHVLIKTIRGSLQPTKGYIWAICGAVVAFLSLEVCLVSNQVFFSHKYSYNGLITVYVQTGLPVLWGLLSFGMMWLGMRYKNRPLRIISLSLFTITLIKLFIFDLRYIPAAGKVAAFFCLGVLLLIVSFMYQKVKKIIADDRAGQDV